MTLVITNEAEEAIMSMTMTCGCPAWECDLLGHANCESTGIDFYPVTPPRPSGPRVPQRGTNPFGVTAYPLTPRPMPPRPGPRRGVTLAEQAHQAREAKRTAEWIKSANKAAEQRRLDEERRRDARNAELADIVVNERKVAAQREVHVEQSMSIRNPSRPPQKCRTMRVWEIASEIDRTSAETIVLLREHGEFVRNAQSTVVWPAVRDFFATQMAAEKAENECDRVQPCPPRQGCNRSRPVMTLAPHVIEALSDANLRSRTASDQALATLRQRLSNNPFTES